VIAIKTFFYRLGTFLMLFFRLYQVNSWFYRWTFRRKYLKYPVSTYNSFDELVAFVQTLEWIKDGWQQRGDAFDYPEAVEYIGRYGDKKIGDCDEFAVYIATALQKSVNAKQLSGVDQIRIMTITWISPEGRGGGHNVCFMRFPDVSLPGLRYGYMDYGQPRSFASITDTVKGVVEHYSAGATCTGWGILDPRTLATLEYRWKV
jgi:hypothetical protein